MLEPQRTVGQASVTIVEELVDRTREDQPVVRHHPGDVPVFNTGPDLDIFVVQHPLEHGGIAVQWHGLERIGEVAVVGIGPRRNTRGHRLVELGRIQTPLLAGIAAEEGLIELAPDGRDHDVLRRPHHGHRLGARGEEAGGLFVALQIEPEQDVQRGPVDRHRHKVFADLGQHSVLIGTPAGEARQIGEHLRRVGVEDVRSVFVDHDAGVVEPVEGVAPDVRTPVQDQHALAAV